MNQKAEDDTNTEELDDVIEVDEVEGDETETKESADDSDDEDDTVTVSIGEESPTPEDEQASAPEWVRELRKTNREDKRRIRELEEKLKAVSTETKPVQLSKKPTLEDHDYDAEKFEASLEQWYEQKRQVDEQNAKAESEAKSQQQAWDAKLNKYNEAKAKLKVRDFDDAEEFVRETLSVTQQGIIVKGSENPELLIYALGRNKAKAKELAAIKDPVEYAFAVAKLETQLKVTPRKAPPPERTVTGTGRSSGAVDSTLERLRSEAEKSGDYTKVVRYRNQQKSKQS